MQISQTAFLLYSLIILLVGGALGAWITRLLMRYPFGRNPLTGKDAYVGKKAVVVNKKPGLLRVSINSQVWNAESSDLESIKVGDTVIVMGMDSLTLKVEKKASPEGNVSLDAISRGPAS